MAPKIEKPPWQINPTVLTIGAVFEELRIRLEDSHGLVAPV
jgi:hypothetical protein